MSRTVQRFVAGCTLAVASACAAALTIELPPENATYRPGPHVELANARCLTCHSSDYVATQPPDLPRATWTAEVNKMRKVYGAPIADEDVEPLADYLVKTYGNEHSDGAAAETKHSDAAPGETRHGGGGGTY